MKIDIKRACTFLFNEKDWRIKILIGIALTFATVLISNGFYQISQHLLQNSLPLKARDAQNIYIIIGTIFSLPINIVITGFILNTAHNELHDINPRLPEWSGNIKKFFLQGLTSFIITFIYLTILYIFSFISGATVTIMNLWLRNILVLLPFITIAIIFLIIFLLIQISATLEYINNFNFLDAFKIKEVFSVLIKGYPYFILILIASTLISVAITTLLNLPSIKTTVIPASITFLIQIISMNLFAPIYKQAKQKI